MTLYYTKHKVVGVPYHRQKEGILSFYQVMENKYDDVEVKRILKQANVDYIFTSRSACYMKPATRESLAGLMVMGQQPDWLTTVNIPREFEDVVLMKVDQTKLR
jgi:hypothetical protein